MPAPGIYEEGQIDPFIDNDPIGKGVQPGVLYATDRAVAAADDKKYAYYTHERGGVLRLGEGADAIFEFFRGNTPPPATE